VSKDLDYTYFSQHLLTEYRETHGALAGLYYDPRGVLYEPHSGGVVALGTREVDDYAFPAWEYDKILYVEKKGLWPIIQAAQLAQRYDLAVVAAEGYASEAARTLFAAAGATDKVLPPDNVLADEAERAYAAAVRAVVEDTARQVLAVETVVGEVAATLRPAVLGGPLADTVRAAHAATPARSWRQALREATRAAVLAHTEQLREYALARFRREGAAPDGR
jgi:hypothetical protein